MPDATSSSGPWSSWRPRWLAFAMPALAPAGAARHVPAGPASRGAPALSHHALLEIVEPFLRRMIGKTTSVGFMPSCRYNWEEDDWIQVPVGLGFDHLTQLGPLPLQWGAEFYYNVARSDILGSEYQFRLYLNTVVPSPAWTRRALFGR